MPTLDFLNNEILMTSLPFEIIHLICSFLRFRDQRFLPLVCTSFYYEYSGEPITLEYLWYRLYRTPAVFITNYYCTIKVTISNALCFTEEKVSNWFIESKRPCVRIHTNAGDFKFKFCRSRRDQLFSLEVLDELVEYLPEAKYIG